MIRWHCKETERKVKTTMAGKGKEIQIVCLSITILLVIIVVGVCFGYLGMIYIYLRSKSTNWETKIIILQHRDACLYSSQNLAMCLNIYSTRRVMENLLIITINSGQNADFVEEMVHTSWVVFVLQNLTNHIVIENV